MTERILLTKAYPPPPIDRNAILRYAGTRETSKELEARLDDCITLASHAFSYRVCWREYPIRRSEDGVLDLTFAKTDSRSLCRHLDGCERIVLFAATVGLEIDRLVARQTALSPANALLLNALGVERVEALCDAFEAELAEKVAQEGGCIRSRFSPGYGDLPLELQHDVVAALDTPRKIGLTLNQSLLLSPSKSVTAIIGIQQRRNS